MDDLTQVIAQQRQIIGASSRSTVDRTVPQRRSNASTGVPSETGLVHCALGRERRGNTTMPQFGVPESIRSTAETCGLQRTFLRSARWDLGMQILGKAAGRGLGQEWHWMDAPSSRASEGRSFMSRLLHSSVRQQDAGAGSHHVTSSDSRCESLGRSARVGGGLHWVVLVVLAGWLESVLRV